MRAQVCAQACAQIRTDVSVRVCTDVSVCVGVSTDVGVCTGVCVRAHVCMSCACYVHRHECVNGLCVGVSTGVCVGVRMLMCAQVYVCAWVCAHCMHRCELCVCTHMCAQLCCDFLSALSSLIDRKSCASTSHSRVSPFPECPVASTARGVHLL